MEKKTPKVSVVLLTYNRAQLVERSVNHNLANAGYPIHEVIWVDNGSTDGVRDFMATQRTDIKVLHRDNLGVAKGYNAGYEIASGDYVAKPGTDILMPKDWLKCMVECAETVPNTGVVAIHCGTKGIKERQIGAEEDAGPYRIIPAKAIGPQLINRQVFAKVGFLPEEFGLYGWDDVVWGQRVRNAGFKTYYINYLRAIHLYDGDQKYTDFKIGEVRAHAAKFQEVYGRERQIPNEIPGTPGEEEADASVQ